MRRGEVWLCTLDPTVGTEISKTRPCLIVSPDSLNAILRRVIIAPLTSGSYPAPFRVAVTFRDKPGLILPDQVRTLDKARLVKRLGRVEASVLTATLAASLPLRNASPAAVKADGGRSCVRKPTSIRVRSAAA